jgi:hypothetical protein
LISRQVNASAGENTIPIDLSGLKSGMYFIRITTGSGSVTGKVVIR